LTLLWLPQLFPARILKAYCQRGTSGGARRAAYGDNRRAKCLQRSLPPVCRSVCRPSRAVYRPAALPLCWRYMATAGEASEAADFASRRLMTVSPSVILSLYSSGYRLLFLKAALNATPRPSFYYAGHSEISEASAGSRSMSERHTAMSSLVPGTRIPGAFRCFMLSVSHDETLPTPAASSGRPEYASHFCHAQPDIRKR